jgi:hypothetical protein
VKTNYAYEDYPACPAMRVRPPCHAVERFLPERFDT